MDYQNVFPSSVSPQMKRYASEKGLSLLEVLIASTIAIIAIAGILYIYHIQHKNMVVQSGVAEMHMNSQYTLQETQYYLKHAGVGLPNHRHNIFPYGQGLGLRQNLSQKKITAVKHSSGNSSTRTTFRIPFHSDSLFKYFVWPEGCEIDTTIQSISIVGNDTLLVIPMNSNNFPNAPTPINLIPVEHQYLARDTQSFFRVQALAGSRSDLVPDTLTLAEGIDTLSFKFVSIEKCTTSVLPVDLDTIQRILIKVSARTLKLDGTYAGDGYHRESLQASISYHRNL